MAATRTSRAVQGVATSSVQTFLAMILQFALVPVILGNAGQEVLGAYAFLLQAVAWTAFADLGFGVAFGRALAQAHGLDDRHARFCTIFTTGRAFYVISNLVVACALLALSWRPGSLLAMAPDVESGARLSLIALSLWVAVRVVIYGYGDALNASQNLAASNVIAAFGSTLRLVMSLVLVMIGAGLLGLMLANIVAEAVTLFAQRGWYRRLYPSDRSCWIPRDRALFIGMFRFGMAYMGVIIAARLASSTDRIIVGSLWGASAVSIYYTTQMPAMALVSLISRLTDNSSPALNELFGNRSHASLAEAYVVLLRYSLLLALPLALGVAAFNKNIISLWVGTGQYAGMLFTFSLALFAFTQIMIHIYAINLTVFGAVSRMSRVLVALGVVRVVVAIALGRALGLGGVVLASALTDIPALIYLSRLSSDLLNLSRTRLWVEAYLPAAKANFLPSVLAVAATLRPLPSLAPVLLALFVVASAVGIWVSGANPTEKKRIVGFLSLQS